MDDTVRDSGIDAPPLRLSPSAPHKGRGAVSNLQGRYETWTREAADDGWPVDEAVNGRVPASVLPTQVIMEQAKSILSRNRSPDLPFEVSLNPYRGCEHGCVYCFARPSHGYLGLSPGLDFESRIYAKVNAAALLRQELGKASYVPRPIALGVNTDAYQPCEKPLRLTRGVLEVLHACRHPVALITKSALIERDADLIADMASRRQAVAAVTLSTLDPAVARTLEPRAAAPGRRLRTIRTLADAGIPVGVSVAPVIPFITEPDLERILASAAEAGAVGASYVVLRLPWEVGPLFRQWLDVHFPERAQRVMNRIREMRGGKDYDAAFGARMHGEGVWADMIRRRFEVATARLGLAIRSNHFRSLDGLCFRPPAAAGVPANGCADTQLELFSGNRLP